MLNIPDPIKELFRQDGVLKNVRITFPNGERADISNDKLVRESLSFTESLASSDPIVFGLCEASSISFSCVGIENINGLRIFVYIEIDISSLTAAQKAQWGQTSSDVPFTFYPVPLGLFVVDECTRESDFNVRKVVAYSPFLQERGNVSSFQNLMPYDQKKASGANWGTAKTMSVDWRNLAILAGQGIFNYNDLVPLSLDSQVSKSYSSIPNIVRRIAGYDFNDNAIELQISVSWLKYFTVTMNAREYDEQTGAWSVIDCTSLPWTGNYIWWWGSYDKSFLSKFNAAKQRIRNAIKARIKVAQLPKSIDGFVNDTLNQNCYGGNILHAWTINQNSNPVAPSGSVQNYGGIIPINSYFALNGEIGTMFPMEIEVKLEKIIDQQTTEVISTDTYDLTNNNVVDLYQVHPTESALFGNLTGGWSGQGFFRFDYNSEKINKRQSFANVWKNMPFDTMLENILEVCGYFGGLGRDGNFRIYDITSAIQLFPSYEIYPSQNIYPVSSENSARMTREDYIKVWYDEYVTHYGTIHVEYKDEDGEDAEYTEYLIDDHEKADKMPVYDLSNNALFIKIATDVAVEYAISNVKRAIKALAYCRSDVSMRALPYMEIGDMLFVKAKDDTFVTPIVSHSITGIQDLRDSVKST